MSNLQLLLDNQAKIKAATKEIRDFVNKVVDKGSFVEKDAYLTSDTFFDGVEALGEGVLTGYATINDRRVTIIAQNAAVLGGSMSKAHAKKIVKAFNHAEQTGTPVVSILDSTGARIAEGVDVLEGYADILSAAISFKDFGQHIAVIKGNAVGLTAVYAQCASIVMMGTEGVTSLDAPKSVIAKAGLNEPATKQLGAQAISAKGNQVSLLYKDVKDLKNKINNTLAYMQGDMVDTDDDPNRTADNLNKKFVNLDVVKALVDDQRYFEINAQYEEDVLTAYASINTRPVAIVATNMSGKSPKLTCGGMEKIIRFLSTVQAMQTIFIVDCEGIETCLACEQSYAIETACNLVKAIHATWDKVAIITGNAIGLAYTAFCSKGLGTQHLIAFPDAVVSAVNAKIAVDILEDSAEYKASKDPVATKAKLVEKYEQEVANPFRALKNGYVDQIIVPSLVRPYVASILGDVEE